jgi:translation initiation factor IF-2
MLTVASAAWSTSTARTSRRRCRRGRCRSSVSPRFRALATTCSSSTRIASPARSPTGAARASATHWLRGHASLILKGDNSGTVEALEEALLGIAIDDEVELRVIDRGVGGITETNVNLASASDAIIIGFNVRAEGKATELANREGVEIRYYSVIYQAIDEIEKALKGMLKPIYEERDLGRAEIRAIFRSSKVGNIAGCLVQSGIMRRNAKARLLRDNVVVAENLTISSLKREKDDATEVREGFECGLTVTYADIKEGDIIETYELVEKARV